MARPPLVSRVSPPDPTDRALVDWRRRWRPYRAVLASRIRSQRSYRANFAVDVMSSLLVGLVELAEIWVLYRAANAIGGLSLANVLLVYGFTEMSFSLGDMLFGHCDRLPTYLREGQLDVFYLRPQPVLLQLITSDISLRRLARTAVGLGAFVVGWRLNNLALTPAHVALGLISLVSGVAIFAATFVAAAGLQFFVVNGPEFANAFTYGGRYAATQPASVWPKPLLMIFGFLVPVVFVGYLPTLRLLGLDSPFGLSSTLAWASPIAAVWMWSLALFLWRSGTRHYQGGGG